jgi:hypothetical protein
MKNSIKQLKYFTPKLSLSTQHSRSNINRKEKRLTHGSEGIPFLLEYLNRADHGQTYTFLVVSRPRISATDVTNRNNTSMFV